jgi:recombination protein RecA
MNKIDEIENNFLKKIINREEDILINNSELEYITGLIKYHRGSIIEIFGEESKGKTTLIWKILSNLCEDNLACYLDAENSFDGNYAEKIGVNIKNLGFVSAQLDYDKIINKILKIKEFDLFIIDSFSALNDIDLEKLISIIHHSNKCVIFTNQIRCNIKKRKLTSYGQLKKYTDIRIEIKKKTYIKDHDKVMGMTLLLKVVKNKLAIPFKEVELPIYFKK